VRIVSWNMNRLGRSRANHRRAWDYLDDELKADLALVQEASPPEQFRSSVYHPIDKNKYNWGSAVVALRPGLVLQPRQRVRLEECYLAPVGHNALPDSHPGACAVADVLNAYGQRLFTAVSLYGQWEVMPGGKTMHACARVHRMLSDLTGVLATSRRHPVVLAGDLNLTTQLSPSKQTQAGTDLAAAAAAVFARLRTWGLTDCLAHMHASRPPLAQCTCPEEDGCTHVQTFRSNNRVDSTPTQLDYAFVSESIVPTLNDCRVIDDAAAWQLSDHCPIVLEVDEKLACTGAAMRRPTPHAADEARAERAAVDAKR
jgi:exonuclease III